MWKNGNLWLGQRGGVVVVVFYICKWLGLRIERVDLIKVWGCLGMEAKWLRMLWFHLI